MKQLFFMRHGLSEMNKQGLYSGRTDTPLALEGQEQCRKAGFSLKDAGIELIISSPMRRAYDSALIVAEVISYPIDSIILNALFTERDLGSLEGSSYVKGLPMNDYAGVEHSVTLIDRAREGLLFLNSLEADILLVVSHSAMGRALKHAIDPSFDFNNIGTFGNAEVIRLI